MFTLRTLYYTELHLFDMSSVCTLMCVRGQNVRNGLPTLSANSLNWKHTLEWRDTTTTTMMMMMTATTTATIRRPHHSWKQKPSSTSVVLAHLTTITLIHTLNDKEEISHSWNWLSKNLENKILVWVNFSWHLVEKIFVVWCVFIELGTKNATVYFWRSTKF